jgi:hypothetical protein
LFFVCIGNIFSAELVLYVDEGDGVEQENVISNQIENADQLILRKRKSQILDSSILKLITFFKLIKTRIYLGASFLKYDLPNKIELIIDWKNIVKNYMKAQGLGNKIMCVFFCHNIAN